MRIDVVNNLAKEDWRYFVDTHPAGTIFHTPEMFEVFSRTRGYQPEFWAAVQDQRVLALFLPVKIILMGGLFRKWTTRSVVYGSILCEPGLEGEAALDKMLQTYVHSVHHESLFTELRNLYDSSNYQHILRRHGFLYENHLNYLIHLDFPENELLQRIGSRTRKNIRHGLNQGRVSVEEAPDRKHVAICYDLLRQTYKAAHVPLADISLFENAFDLLYRKSMAKFTLAYFDQVPVAVSVDLFYKNTVYGWYGGVRRAFGNHPVHELLMWDILKWGSQHGFRVYDFGGAGRPDETYGVRDFKSKFGGELVDYGRNKCVHSRWRLRLSEIGYHVLRGRL
jgi:serine/alanine adding enzyme